MNVYWVIVSLGVSFFACRADAGMSSGFVNSIKYRTKDELAQVNQFDIGEVELSFSEKPLAGPQVYIDTVDNELVQVFFFASAQAQDAICNGKYNKAIDLHSDWSYKVDLSCSYDEKQGVAVTFRYNPAHIRVVCSVGTDKDNKTVIFKVHDYSQLERMQTFNALRMV